jgi:hypothetical protein
MFVRSNATQALRRNLLLSSNLTTEIIEFCTPVEMVMLNANLPHLKNILLAECARTYFDDYLYTSLDESILEETFGNLTKKDFGVEFTAFYDNKLKDFIKYSLGNLISALLSLKSGLGLAPPQAFDFIKHTANETDQQNIIIHAVTFADTAKAEIITTVISDGYNPEKPTYTYLPRIAEKFNYFSSTSQAQFISTSFVSEMTLANILMRNYLGMEFSSRYNSLLTMSAAAIKKFEESLINCLDKAFYLLQMNEGRDKRTLKTALGSFFMSDLPMRFNSDAQKFQLTEAIINDKFVSSLISLPAVVAINNTHRLDEKSINKNKMALREAFFMIQEEGQLVHDVALHSLPNPNPNVNIETTVAPNDNWFMWEAGACFLIAIYGAYRAYSFFQKPQRQLPALRGLSAASEFSVVEATSPTSRMKFGKDS